MTYLLHSHGVLHEVNFFKRHGVSFFGLFFEELHMYFSLHYNGVLYEVNFLKCNGVRIFFFFLRTPYVFFFAL